MSINPKSVEFHQCHAKPHSICFFFFFITISKRTKEIFAKICWQLKTPTPADLKVHALHYANELLVRVRLSFQKTFAKSLNMQKQYEKNVWENGNDASIRVQTTITHISIFTFLCIYDNINVKENVFFQSESWKKHCATQWRERRGWDLVILMKFWLVRSEHAHASYPWLFFRPPGFSPYNGAGRKKSSGTGLDLRQRKEAALMEPWVLSVASPKVVLFNRGLVQ